MSRRPQRFTIYDVLEQNGYFEANPANADSRDSENTPLYTGPVEFPKMLYHPEGTMEVTVPGETIMTPIGPKLVGQQKQLIHRIVRSAAEEAALLDEGWHQHPKNSLRASAGLAPEVTPLDQIAALQAQIQELQFEKNSRESGTVAVAATSTGSGHSASSGKK